jgi:hypothetical protein
VERRAKISNALKRRENRRDALIFRHLWSTVDSQIILGYCVGLLVIVIFWGGRGEGDFQKRAAKQKKNEPAVQQD